MRNFDACALCLQRARDPISCDLGHLFCKECAYADLRMQLCVPPARHELRDTHSEPEEGYQETERAPRTAQERGRRREATRVGSCTGTRSARFREGSTHYIRELACHCLDIWRRVHQRKCVIWCQSVYLYLTASASQFAQANGNLISIARPLRRLHGRLRKLHSG